MFTKARTSTTTTHRYPRTANLLTHILFIGIIFILPELMLSILRPNRTGIFTFHGVYLKNMVYIAVFYINYFVIIRRTLGRDSSRHGMIKLLLVNLGVLIGGIALCLFINAYCFPHHHKGTLLELSDGERLMRAMPFTLRDMAMLILTIGLAVALRLSVMWRNIDRKHQELLAATTSTELDSLKSQLNPHFLFNSLNTIYALIDISPEDAKNAVHRLSGLLRYMLDESPEGVTLEKEANFLADYVALMKLRMGRRPIVLETEIGGYEDTVVSPHLFIPLIENAFKYGYTSPTEESIAITLKAKEGVLLCATRNGYTPTEAIPEQERPTSSGIGLANLRRRLQLIYGNRATLKAEGDGRIFHATLSIPLTEDEQGE